MELYDVYITWKNKNGKRWTTPCSEAFIDIFNAGARAVNPYFDQWNRLYDVLYPEKEGTVADESYYRFIARMATDELRKLGCFRVGLRQYHLEYRWDEDEQTSLMCVVRWNGTVGSQLCSIKSKEVPD